MVRLCFYCYFASWPFVLIQKEKKKKDLYEDIIWVKHALNWKDQRKDVKSFSWLAMKCLSFYLPSTRSLVFLSIRIRTLAWVERERKSGLLLQTVPLEKPINAVFKNPCSLMYRFVLLSIGFNLMVYLYLTFSPPSCRLLFVLHYAGVGFQESASVQPVCARVIICAAALRWRATDSSFTCLLYVPGETEAGSCDQSVSSMDGNGVQVSYFLTHTQTQTP